ncbi:patatin-like phospholipase family protein [Pseudomonas sp. MDT2-39-1]
MQACAAQLLIIFTIFLASCTTNHDLTDYKRYPDGKEDWRTTTEIEQNFYRTSRSIPSGTPDVGIALSGGGQRAASVSIGFLSALDEQGILQDVDIISSVSGGSYAAYWWYTKRYSANLERESTAIKTSEHADSAPLYNRYYPPGLCAYFKKNYTETPQLDRCKNQRAWKYKFHRHNLNSGHLLTYSQEYTQAPELFGKTLSWIITTPVHWVANGLFDMKLNANLFQNYYQNGLEREYGLYPGCKYDETNCKLKDYTNSRLAGLRAINPAPNLLLTSMKEKHEPYWVINTTAAYNTRSAPKMFRFIPAFGYSKSLYDSVYEFSPTVQGSPRFGYCFPGNSNCVENNIELSRQVALSGAAFDSLPAGANSAIDIFNLALGQYISNPKVSDGDRTIHRVIPAPFVWFHENRHDETAPFIYLSDGGHSDNLGLYSLVRRGTKKIIVLDAESENGKKGNKSVFEALKSDRCKLGTERNILIDIPELTNSTDKSKTPCSGEAGPSDIDYKAAKNSVYRGNICQMNKIDFNAKCDPAKSIQLIYVKLSYDYSKNQKCLKGTSNCLDPKNYLTPSDCAIPNARYSCDTLWFAINNQNDKFPHAPTTDVFYSLEQYAGYTALGFDLGREAITKIQNSSSSPVETN